MQNEKYNLNEEQMLAMEILRRGKNVFLSGDAGTGKSYVLNAFIEENRNKKIIKCAPTGIAALNIGGATLHRVFKPKTGVQIPNNYQKNPGKVLENADIIIIDEISMCRIDLFEFVINTLFHLKNAKERQIILVGDFYQLPPVIEEYEKRVIERVWDMNYFKDGYPFRSKYWNELNLESVILHNVVRQDDLEFVRRLQDIRRGRQSAAKWLNENSCKDEIKDAIYLCSRNDKVNEINKKRSSLLETEYHTYNAEESGMVYDSDKPTNELLELKVGMRVMTLANRPDEGYINGSMGTITGLNDKYIDLKLDINESIVRVYPYTWDIIDYDFVDEGIKRVVVGQYTQMPVKIAYAITIHKSQGQTYEAANIDPFCHEAGQLYVAISRVKSIQNIHFESEVQKYHIKANDDVDSFYRKLNR